MISPLVVAGITIFCTVVSKSSAIKENCEIPRCNANKAKRGYSERWGYFVGSNIFKTPQLMRSNLKGIFYYYSRLYPTTLSSEASVVSEIFEQYGITRRSK